jgi:hypothetical protein
MSTQDDEFNWRQSLERISQAALDLVNSLGTHPTGEHGASSGAQKTESRQVSGFTQIKLLGFGTLNITQGETDSLTITADEDMLPHLTSEVVNGTLELGVKPRLLFKSLRHVTYAVTIQRLEGVQLSGAGTVHATGVKTAAFNVAISGAGDMSVSGGAQSQNVRISGAGNYNASEFQTDTADVTITGAGNARINATQMLYATISGAGAITYHGMPQVSQRITGVGSVKQA